MGGYYSKSWKPFKEYPKDTCIYFKDFDATIFTLTGNKAYRIVPQRADLAGFIPPNTPSYSDFFPNNLDLVPRWN